MSSRNIRKIFGDNPLPLEGTSDEANDPISTKATGSKFSYDCFKVSSESDKDGEKTEEVVDENQENDNIAKKKKKKKNRRKAKRSRKPLPTDPNDGDGSNNLVTGEDQNTQKEITEKNIDNNVSKKKKSKNKKKFRKTSKVLSEDGIELDEIDISLMEVEATLGAPPPAKLVSKEEVLQNSEDTIFSVKAVHLNAANELNRLYGRDSEQENRRNVPHNLRPRDAVVPLERYTSNFNKHGLSMSLCHRIDDVLYFAYDHSTPYQAMHAAYLQQRADVDSPRQVDMENDDVDSDDPDSPPPPKMFHVENVLQVVDLIFSMREYKTAEYVLEQAIAHLQFVSHPLFGLTRKNVRLEYVYLENRPFHVAFLKYIHLLTNKGCHRTALELAKVLLKLDPSDPLAVIFIIDTLAIRAREHQWLIDAVEYWYETRQASFLFNLQYSTALAHFHVITKKKDDISEADKLIQNAILRFPIVVIKLYECASVKLPAKMQSSQLFITMADKKTTIKMKDLMHLYAKFSWPRWREPPVLEWLTRNVNEVAEKYDNDVQIQEQAKSFANENLNLFQRWPEQIIRHLCVIQRMAQLLVDGEMPRVQNKIPADPVPPLIGINRHRYDVNFCAVKEIHRSPFCDFFSSLSPNYNINQQDQEPRDYRDILNDLVWPIAGEDAGGEEDNVAGGTD